MKEGDILGAEVKTYTELSCNFQRSRPGPPGSTSLELLDLTTPLEYYIDIQHITTRLVAFVVQRTNEIIIEQIILLLIDRRA